VKLFIKFTAFYWLIHHSHSRLYFTSIKINIFLIYLPCWLTLCVWRCCGIDCATEPTWLFKPSSPLFTRLAITSPVGMRSYMMLPCDSGNKFNWYVLPLLNVLSVTRKCIVSYTLLLLSVNFNIDNQIMITVRHNMQGTVSSHFYQRYGSIFFLKMHIYVT